MIAWLKRLFGAVSPVAPVEHKHGHPYSIHGWKRGEDGVYRHTGERGCESEISKVGKKWKRVDRSWGGVEVSHHSSLHTALTPWTKQNDAAARGL